MIEEHQRQDFFNKIANCRPATLLKRDSGTGTILEKILQGKRRRYNHSQACFSLYGGVKIIKLPD